MRLIAELARRNVIRMAGLYLVASWLIVQVAGTVLPMFGAPEWIGRSIVVMLAIGFVPVLAFAWIYELTPEGLQRDQGGPATTPFARRTARRMNVLIVAGLCVAVAVAVGAHFGLFATRTESAGQASSAPKPAVAAHEAAPAAGGAAVEHRPSIAVLPFVNMSADADNRYFSDGIAEELLNVLAHVNGIDVASRTSSFAYEGKNVGTADIAKALKVDHILEGSVRKAGKHVRITAQLIDAVHDRQVWSQTYDRELTDIFKIQEEIATAIVGALRGSLGAAGDASVKVRADTQNLSAYELYLKARELFVTRSDIAQGMSIAERVVQLDPKFARGWELLAALYAVAPSWRVNDRDYPVLAQAAAEHALQLDPSLSMPWAAMGLALQVNERTVHVDWARALSMEDKAVAADAKNATALLWRAQSQVELGFFERALRDLDACLRVDPAYLNCTRWKAVTLLYLGKDDEALALFERGVAVGFVENLSNTFIPLLIRRGDRIGARLLLQRLHATPELADVLMTDVVKPGLTPAEAVALVHKELPVRHPGRGLELAPAKVLVWLGAFDAAIDAGGNNTANAAKALGLDQIIAWEPYPPGFRNSEAFKRVLELLGVADYWRKHGYPPQCRAVGARDFHCD